MMKKQMKTMLAVCTMALVLSGTCACASAATGTKNETSTSTAAGAGTKSDTSTAAGTKSGAGASTGTGTTAGAASGTNAGTEADARLKEYVTDDVMEALDNIWGDVEYDIKNTQVVTIKDNDTDVFRDADYVVQFMILSDYYETGVLELEVGINNAVMVYKDGTVTAMPRDPFILHIQQTYNTDLSGIVDEVIDASTAYNEWNQETEKQ